MPTHQVSSSTCKILETQLFRVHFQIQYMSEMKWHPEPGAITYNYKTKNQKRDDKMNSDGLMADRLVWLDFKVNLEKDCMLPHSNGTHFLSDRNCNFWLNQNHKGFLQNTHWRSSTSCRKVQ